MTVCVRQESRWEIPENRREIERSIEVNASRSERCYRDTRSSL